MIRIPIKFTYGEDKYWCEFIYQPDGSFLMYDGTYYRGRLSIDDEGWLWESEVNPEWFWLADWFGMYVISYWDCCAYFMR